jgi:hypothetical protein
MSNDYSVNKVNWLRKFQTASGLELSVSDRSGLVKIGIGANRRDPALFRDEIMFILDNALELRQYLADHEDVIKTQEVHREQSKANRFKSKAASTAAQGLMALGFTAEQIVDIMAKKQA